MRRSGSPRFVLVCHHQKILMLTASEGDSQTEFRRLVGQAKKIVLQPGWNRETDSVQIFLVMEPESLTQGGLLTDLQVHEWLSPPAP